MMKTFQPLFCLFCCVCAAVAVSNEPVSKESGSTAFLTQLKQSLSTPQGAISPCEDAAGACDGKVTNNFSFHTNQDRFPWWEVDLESVRRITKIVVYNPHVPDRLSEFQIRVAADASTMRSAGGTLVYQAPKADPAVKYEIPLENVSGRIVRIQVPRTEYMHLDEVMVFGPESEDSQAKDSQAKDSQAKDVNLALNKPAEQSSVSQWSTRSRVLSKPLDLSVDSLKENFAAGERFLRNMAGQTNCPNEFQTKIDRLLDDKILLDAPEWNALFWEIQNNLERTAADKLQFELMRFVRREHPAVPVVSPQDITSTVFDTTAPEPLAALERGLKDLADSCPDRFADKDQLLAELNDWKRRYSELQQGLAENDPKALAEIHKLVQFQRDILLRNPLLDFDSMIVLKRALGESAHRAMGAELGVATLNAHTNDSLRRWGWTNEIAVLKNLRTTPTIQTLYTPEDSNGPLITDLELDFNADRLMFSSIGANQKNWRLFELDIPADINKPTFNAVSARQITPDDGEDVGHFDSCYLADPDEIIFCSTAAYQGLPCEYGSRRMTCLYKMNRTIGAIRQLTFEQDSDWSPVALPNGRVLYQRWEYSDLPHSNSRILFQMNPDGTAQMPVYNRASYFMPSYFYAKPIPASKAAVGSSTTAENAVAGSATAGSAAKIVGIAGGHHGTPRSGRLIIIDPRKGMSEVDGVVQEIPGYGKPVVPIVMDRLVDWTWPHFLHPAPLNEKYFIVAMKPAPDALWGIYLVDIFDNMTLLYQSEGFAFLDPTPLESRPVPPLIADKVVEGEKEATIFLADIYNGPGLEGVPRSTVKSLRIGTYYFSTSHTGGLLGSLGIDGPWDIKKILGTVPVEADGSAFFRIPANTPIFIQPLDQEGKALQLMRSWLVGMPGETVSCNGCHEQTSSAVSSMRTAAAFKPPVAIESRSHSQYGFSFVHEVQPVLDKYCVGCHGDDKSPVVSETGQPLKSNLDLRGNIWITDWRSGFSGNCGGNARGGHFTTSYVNLNKYVRNPGIESDIHMLTPCDYHADSTELIQMLKDGKHYNVKMDKNDWEKLITWIDVNKQFHGNWSSVGAAPKNVVEASNPRRRELDKLYAGIDVNYEQSEPEPTPAAFLPPEQPRAPQLQPVKILELDKDFKPQTKTIVLRQDKDRCITMDFVRIPAGKYIDCDGTEAVVDKPFWMSREEVNNEQFRVFNPNHDSRRESRHSYQFGRMGVLLNADDQPAVRIGRVEAEQFCRWLTENKTSGKTAELPSIRQWRWAARAGVNTAPEADFWFAQTPEFAAKGHVPFANVADKSIRGYLCDTSSGYYTACLPMNNPSSYDDWVPYDAEFDDGHFVSASGSDFRPNPWGLVNMNGNVAEWTCDTLTDSNNQPRAAACGGSWYDRLKRCSTHSVTDFAPWQKVFNVGLRVILTE